MPAHSIHGSTLHYLDHGAGFPVLLGHSYLWDATMWAPQVDALSRRYRVIVPDLWGHGESGALPDGTHTLDDLAAHASALLDALEIERCAIVGLSVGGMWGARLALREPQHVRSLVVMDASLEAEPDATRTRYFAMLDAIVPLFFRPDVNLDDPVPTAFRDALANLPADRLRQSIAPLGRLIFGRPDTLATLAELDAQRTLLMCGAGDMARPPSENREDGERDRLRACAGARRRPYLEPRKSRVRHAHAARLVRRAATGVELTVARAVTPARSVPRRSVFPAVRR